MVNVIDPDVAVITNIGLDHTDWIGDTIEQIAFEKAGIIRPEIPVIFAGEQTLPQAIQDKVKACQAKLSCLNQDYFYQFSADGQSWNFASAGTTMQLPTGALALANSAAAVAAILHSGLVVSVQSIAQGIRKAVLPGRFDIRQVAEKTVIFDAGHNPHGVDFFFF